MHLFEINAKLNLPLIPFADNFKEIFSTLAFLEDKWSNKIETVQYLKKRFL
jgi:hypothetical protein